MARLLRSAAFNVLLLVLSGALYACALKYFVFPSRVILTGTEGIAVALSYYFDDQSLFLIVYSISQFVLLCFGFLFVSKPFVLRTLVVVATVAVLLAYLPELRVADPDPKNERILLVIFGGLLAGVAKALAFKQRGSTGDEDVVAAYFATKYLKPVGSIGVIAGVISTLFGLALDYAKYAHLEVVINTLMYTSIYVFVTAETLNNFYRKFRVTMFTVLSQKPDVVGNAIKQAMSHRTYTVQEGVGGRSGRTFKMLRIIITHEELDDVIDEVMKADSSCFYYHHDIEGVSNNYYIRPIG